MLEAGAAAPDFTLPDQDGEEVSLSSLVGETRRRAAFPIGTSSPEEAELCEAGGSIAKRSWLDLGRHQTGELRLGQDPEEGKEIEMRRSRSESAGVRVEERARVGRVPPDEELPAITDLRLGW